jgi:pimeloyl-ACP methyl ester carboxylesterase
VLADTLIHRHAGVRPVSLIGFSLGARTIFYALQELARVKAYGLVQDVVLFGATVTASKSTWLDVRSAVAGRFVNAYATNDWMLGYLFRATSGGLNTVAGLRPVETVPGLENVEVTEIITGHMSYRSCMPLLLAKVGFPVMADYFDEPEVRQSANAVIRARRNNWLTSR